MGELISLFFSWVFRVIAINSPWGKTHLITIVGTCVIVILITVVISRMKKDNQETNIPQEPKVKANVDKIITTISRFILNRVQR